MIHQVFANRSNAGDWLSARGIRALLPEGPVREHLCDEPFVPDTLEALARAGREDLVVIGGGGLLMDYFTPFWEGFRALAPRLNFAVWGVGVVDLKREASLPPLDLVRGILAQARVCRVRDERTREFLAPLELPPPVPCPSLVAVSPRPSLSRGVLHVASLTTVGEAAYERMRAEAQAFAARTRRPFREINNRLPDGREDALQGILQAYADADVLLTARLHGCILAVGMGRKVLAVSGDRKVEGFMEGAGLRDWVLDLADLDEIPRRLEDLPAQPEPAAFREHAVRANRAVAAEVLAGWPG